MPEAYDRNKTQFNDVAVNVMEAILTLMCPITYSPGNLKSLVTKGKRVQNKTTLMRIIERNTGISGEDTIEPSAVATGWLQKTSLRHIVPKVVAAKICNSPLIMSETALMNMK